MEKCRQHPWSIKTVDTWKKELITAGKLKPLSLDLLSIHGTRPCFLAGSNRHFLLFESHNVLLNIFIFVCTRIWLLIYGNKREQGPTPTSLMISGSLNIRNNCGHLDQIIQCLEDKLLYYWPCASGLKSDCGQVIAHLPSLLIYFYSCPSSSLAVSPCQMFSA